MESSLIVAHESDVTIDTYAEDMADFHKGVKEVYGDKGSNAGDFLYVYELEEEEEEGEAAK